MDLAMKLALTATPSSARFAPILLRGSIADAFALAAELGFDGVELHLRRPSDDERVMKPHRSILQANER